MARTVGLLRQRPGALLLLQLPIAFTSLVDPGPSADIQNTSRLILILSIAFPIFVFLSTLSNTATFVLVRHQLDHSPLSPLGALKASLANWRKWLPTGLLLALLTIPGAFAPILIPVAVYFSAIYGFAPFLAMEQPDTPISLHFSRSKQLVAKALWPMLGIAGSLMVVEFVMAFWASDLSGRVGAMASLPWLVSVLSIGTQLSLSLIMSFLVTPFLAVFFLKLRSEP